MSKYFYGVYLEEERVAAALNLIRFLAEPAAIRYAHITLRGPYSRKITSSKLDEINSAQTLEWNVTLLKPIGFISEQQATVAIAVDLMSLASLVYKPDFPNGTPHVTVYDGKDSEFAASLLALLNTWKRWSYHIKVSKLRLIASKRKIDQEFPSFFGPFSTMFTQLLGDINRMGSLRQTPPAERLLLIRRVLAESDATQITSATDNV